MENDGGGWYILPDGRQMAPVGVASTPTQQEDVPMIHDTVFSIDSLPPHPSPEEFRPPGFTSSLLRRAGWVLLAFGMLFAAPADDTWAQSPRKIVLNDGQFKESFLEKVTVSGGIRAGFMHPSSLERVDLHQLYIHVQRPVEEEAAMLCVNMVSRDGRYTASWQYSLGPQQPGAIQVEIPSKYQEQVSAYTPDALVVLAGITAKDCLSAEMRYIPASWGMANTSTSVLYVNSGNTDTEIGIPGLTERIACTKISADSTIAYDTQCEVRNDLLKEPKSLYLLRKNFGNRLPNVEFPVR
jgi:hypothetical protein